MADLVCEYLDDQLLSFEHRAAVRLARKLFERIRELEDENG